MDDLIKRADAIKAVLSLTMYKGSVPVDSVIYNIKHIPSAEELIYEEIQKADIEAKAYAKGFKEGLEARKQGEWIYPTDIIGFGRCNNCKALWDKSLIDNIYFKYCPRCGARMVKGADDE